MIGKKKKYKLGDFNYRLPKKHIAQNPERRRDYSKLMIVHKDSGEIERNYNTGIQVQDLDSMMRKYLNLKYDYGVIITNIESKSSGEKAGLKVGDIILKVDGKIIKRSKDIIRIIDEGLHRTGDEVKITILRNNYSYDIMLKLEGKNSNWLDFY